MKNVVIVILLVATIVFGGLFFKNRRQATQGDAKLVALEKQVADLQADLALREERAASLRSKLEAAQVESVSNAGAAAQLSQALTNQAAANSTNAKPGNPFAEMFKNPEMRDMIKQQQQTAFASLIEKNYADFIKAQNLTLEQAGALKALLAKKMAVGADLGMEMMGGDLTEEQRADLTKRMKTDSDAIAAEIKDFLGADAYAAYEAYEKSVPDRMAIEQFKTQLPEGAQLDSAQEAQLREALSAERQGFKFTTDFTDQSSMSGDIFSKFTEDKMTTFFQEQDVLNQRYLSRAKTILTGDQYNAYEKSLKSQQDLMRMGMTMAAKMFRK